MSQTLRVKGLKDFNRTLRRIDRSLGKRTQKALKQVASEAADDIKQQIVSQYGAVGRKGARGVRPRARQTKATIALLGSNPVIRGLEFGAIVHHLFGRTVLQRDMRRRVFPEWIGNRYTGARANFGQGYVAAATLNEWVESGRVVTALDQALDQALRDAL